MSENPNITITDTLKNVKNIDKVFTEFSQTFSVPASKTNNKIFKHYYNSDIVGGFDSRIRTTAEIELNSIPFKKGFIKLEGVDLRDNKPHTYRITFFGGTVTLKDTLGDDKLSSLNTLTNLNQTYDATNVRNALQDNPTTNDIIVPLITHTERLIYDSTTNDQTAGNLAFDTGHIKGVSYTELKYAIRLHSIIEAIQDKYTTLSFSNDFFVSTNEPYYNLFMWLHRKKGAVENLSGLNESLINTFTNDTDSTTSSVMSNNALSFYDSQRNSIMFRSTTSDTNPYKISIRKNGIEVVNSGEITSGVEAFTLVPSNEMEENAQYTAYIESDFNITFSNLTFRAGITVDGPPPNPWDPPSQIFLFENYTITNFVYLNTFEFDITQQIPDIKIIDFLSGLFKMFNLVAYVEGNQTQVTVKSLDNFYANPSANSPYDISKYIDVSSNQVNSALPYREINFKHEDTKTFLAEKHTQITGQNWGESQFKSTGENGEQLDGSIYKVKTPFAQMKYERLIDVNGGAVKGVQVGYFVDDNQEPYLGKPLLFYPIIRFSSTPIAFLNSPSSQRDITTYNIPSNSVALSSATSSYNMNFNAEPNEWGALDGDNGFTNSLFEAYYKSAIVSLFSPKNRLTKVTAYLPLNILTNYTLADRFIINGKTYKINSIKTNLNTGKSDIELLNDI